MTFCVDLGRIAGFCLYYKGLLTTVNNIIINMTLCYNGMALCMTRLAYTTTTQVGGPQGSPPSRTLLLRSQAHRRKEDSRETKFEDNVMALCLMHPGAELSASQASTNTLTFTT